MLFPWKSPKKFQCYPCSWIFEGHFPLSFFSQLRNSFPILLKWKHSQLPLSLEKEKEKSPKFQRYPCSWIFEGHFPPFPPVKKFLPNLPKDEASIPSLLFPWKNLKKFQRYPCPAWCAIGFLRVIFPFSFFSQLSNFFPILPK